MHARAFCTIAGRYVAPKAVLSETRPQEGYRQRGVVVFNLLRKPFQAQSSAALPVRNSSIIKQIATSDYRRHLCHHRHSTLKYGATSLSKFPKHIQKAHSNAHNATSNSNERGSTNGAYGSCGSVVVC